jgi:hypothetical protein
MSEALARIFALQQREINEQERQIQLMNAKREREVHAFMTSGLPEIFAECADLPLSKSAAARLYKRVLGQCTWDYCDPRKNQVREVAFSSIGGSGSGPRWRCYEDPDSGRMLYIYSPVGSTTMETQSREPTGEWLTAFIEYVAKLCDPQAVAGKLSESQANHAREEYFNRAGRRMQPV